MLSSEGTDELSELVIDTMGTVMGRSASILQTAPAFLFVA
jgi:hypothetical protein